jgi:hypothetical protein
MIAERFAFCEVRSISLMLVVASRDNKSGSVRHLKGPRS